MSHGGKTNSNNKNYFADIAGVVCCGQLDFIWGLIQNDYLVWPTATIVNGNDPWPGTTFHANSIIAYNGIVWETPSATNAQPPAPPWKRFRRNRTDAGMTNPFKITVANNGDCYLYWGTPDQVLDLAAEKFLSDKGHPPYRNRSILALKKYLFGQSSDKAQPPPTPNMIVLGGRAPVQSLITGDATLLDADWQANPWCVLAEMLTHPVIGLGRKLAEFHQDSWQAEAERCMAIASQTYISPVYDDLQKARDMVSDLLSYTDSFVYRGPDGLIYAGHWPHGEAPPAWVAANTITLDALLGEIKLDSDGWGGTTNFTTLNFNDINFGFQTQPMPASNLFNRILTGQLATRTVSRPFIVRANQAALQATEDAKINGDQSEKGTLTCLAEKVADVQPGGHVLLVDDLLGQSKPMRVTAVTLKAPPVGEIDVDVETERGFADQPYSATPPQPERSSLPTPSRITNFQFLEMPDSLAADGQTNRLALLAARNDSITTALDVYWRNADADAFQDLGTLTSFAVAGVMNDTINGADVVNEVITAASAQGDNYNLANQDLWNLTLEWGNGSSWTAATMGTDFSLDPAAGKIFIVPGGAITDGSHVRVNYSIYVHVTLAETTPDSDVESISQSLTADEIADNKLLLFAFETGSPSNYEILTVKNIIADGGGEYRIAVRREQFGTRAGGDGSHVWNASDPIFIQFQDTVFPLENAAFENLFEAAGSATFRLVPSSLWVQGDVADIYDATTNPAGITVETVFDFYDQFAADLTWEIEDLNGAPISDYTVSFLPTDKFQFTFGIVSRSGDLSSARLVARQGSVETLLWSQTLSGSTYSASPTFSIASEGDYQIVALVNTSNGRLAEFPLQSIGGGGAVIVQIRAGGSGIGTTICANPVQTAISKTGNLWNYTIACSTPGAEIEFMNAALYGAATGSWSAPQSNPFTGFTPTQSSVYFKAVKAGLTDSEIIRIDFL
ncbi:MAG TPA: hypothetical protein VHG71_04945 [Verrucomicrobiae bacterium]|nr:hypothetical protein [Verrucomicrobiae bacterium]